MLYYQSLAGMVVGIDVIAVIRIAKRPYDKNPAIGLETNIGDEEYRRLRAGIRGSIGPLLLVGSGQCTWHAHLD